MKLSSFTIILGLIVLICVESIAQKKQFVLGQTERVTSKILDEDRTVFVHVPRGNASKKYPVLYLLDGGQFFPMAVSILKMDEGILPKMIIVGISNSKNRTRDLTPKKYKNIQNSGGGEKFTRFIEKELMPYIEGKYPTHPHRTLVGFSYGGLLAINTLVHHTHLFDNYIIIDPSIRHDERLQKKVIQDLKTNTKFAKKSLYIAVANTLQGITKGADTTNIMQDSTPFTHHIRAGLTLARAAAYQNKSKLSYGWKYYPKDSHVTVPYPSIYDGLRSVFAWYKMDADEIVTVNNPKTSVKKVLEMFNNYYQLISKKFGYQVLPDEEYLNSLGYMYLQTEQPKRAKAFFEMAIRHYPKSANVYDSMADFYLAKKDPKKALEYLNKAYKISGSRQHKKRIKKVKAKM